MTGDQTGSAPRGFAQIDGVYTHFNRLVLVRDVEGDLWADPSWAKDIAVHRRYIPQFRMCAPVESGTPPADWINICANAPLEVIALRPDRGFASVFLNVVPNFLTVARAARGSDIVHSGGAGWAVPNSFALVILRSFFRFRWIVIIESMFWQKPADGSATIRQRIEHALHQFFLGKAVRRADVRIFTHPGYRDYFLPPGAEAMINPASWIEEGDIASGETLRSRDGKGKGPLRLLFAGRLIPEKGLPALKDAVTALAAERAEVEVSILGDGPLRPMCEDLARTFAQGPTRVVYLPPIAYGPAFFHLLSGFDAVLVPSTSDEQPRIIFDAFSQGLPVIAARTSGIQSIADEGTGWLFEPGNPAGLAGAIRAAAADQGLLQEKGAAALVQAHWHTHLSMHQRRSYYIARHLGLAAADDGLGGEDNAK